MAEQNGPGFPPDLDISKLIKDAKKEFYKDPNVIGVGVGTRRKGGVTNEEVSVLIVYVKTKASKDEKPEFPIPSEFQGVATDVVEPFSSARPHEAVGFSESEQHSHDMTNIDRARLHFLRPAVVNAADPAPGNVRDTGNVCVIQDDGTLLQMINNELVVDYVRAYKLFRTTHADIFDFVTFFTDSANGMPPQGDTSWYSYVFNDTQGIGFGPYDQQSSYGSDVLQGIMFLHNAHFNTWRYVMLQEQGHRWAAYARYRDPQTGFNQTDHLRKRLAHWAENLDDDKSPMDYDEFDWVENGANFDRILLSSEERSYSELDLYLMGLLGPDDVKDFFLLSNTALVAGNQFSADKKSLSVQDFINAEGPRIPDVTDSQKTFKNAFVVLTGNAEASKGLVSTVDSLRVRFENDFLEATRNIGEVDTRLRVPSRRRRWW